MSRKEPNKTLIGIFITAGFIIFLSIFFFFVKSKIIVDKNSMFVMFFRESIQGLKVGSPVMFRGVEIGKVVKIDLVVDNDTFDMYIPVYAIINKSNSNKNSIGNSDILGSVFLEKGLKARLATYSFITGQLMIEFDFIPEAKNVFVNKYVDKKIVEIPTVLSSKGELSSGLKDLPLKQMFENFSNTLQSINDDFLPLIRDTDRLVNNIDGMITVYDGKSDNIAVNLNSAISSLNNLLKSMKNFVDYLERHPESLIKGKGN
ncbi:MAG: MCE family protein [Rickettsiales bacterium]|nr:MCE family protein [Rickettsiales bacterium]